MRIETYNKLKTIVHSLYEFKDMVYDETKNSACKVGGLPGDISRVNVVIERCINDLNATKYYMRNVEKMEEFNKTCYRGKIENDGTK